MTGAEPPLRVGSVPADHPFVVACHDERTVVVADPLEPATGRALLDPVSAGVAARKIDVVVVHFGFEWQEPSRLVAALQTLRAAGVGVVAVVHDLQNPHLRDQQRHADRLDAVVGLAHEVLTLTPAAARAVHRRWHRVAGLLEHPTLLDHAPPRPAMGTVRRIGLHLKTLRANVRARDALTAVEQVVGSSPGVVGDVLLDREVADPGHPRHDASVLADVARLDARPGVVATTTPRLDDRELHAWLASKHALLLPYGWGTHSGWIELCKDLGVHAVAPSGGGYSDQGARFVFDRGSDGPDVMAAALRAAVASVPASPADRARRLAERRSAADVLHRTCLRARSSARTTPTGERRRLPTRPPFGMTHREDEAP